MSSLMEGQGAFHFVELLKCHQVCIHRFITEKIKDLIRILLSFEILYDRQWNIQ